jgi:hypothetical protein
MQVAGVTIGAVAPPIVLAKFAPTVAKTQTGAAAANVAVGGLLAFGAEKMGQRALAKAIMVGAGAATLTDFVSKALDKSTGKSGFLTEEQVQNWPQLAAG